MLAPLQDNMRSPAPVTTIRTRHGIELGLHKMLAASTSVPASRKYPDLVDKI